MLHFLASSLSIYLAYAAVATACGLSALESARRDGGRGRAALWLAVALVLVALVMLKLYGVESTLASSGRAAVHRYGWYADRRFYQRLGIAVIGAVGGLAAMSVLALRPAGLHWLLLTLLALCAFVAVRAISLHQVDGLLYRHGLLGAAWSNIIELTLLGVVGICAVAANLHAGGSRDGRR